MKNEVRSSEEQKSLNSVKELFLQAGQTTKETQIYSGVDLINSNGKKIEVKNRRFSKREFMRYAESGGFMMEKKKYEELVINNGYYCNTFNFGNLINDQIMEIIVWWRIGTYGITTTDFSIKSCPSTTDFNKKNNRNKEVCYMSINEAKIFIKKNKWCIISKEELYSNLLSN